MSTVRASRREARSPSGVVAHRRGLRPGSGGSSCTAAASSRLVRRAARSGGTRQAGDEEADAICFATQSVAMAAVGAAMLAATRKWGRPSGARVRRRSGRVTAGRWRSARSLA
eukprot:scaffold4372_cov397-Prasinococcus_capsulatus_cf.AAC.2